MSASVASSSYVGVLLRTTSVFIPLSAANRADVARRSDVATSRDATVAKRAEPTAAASATADTRRTTATANPDCVRMAPPLVPQRSRRNVVSPPLIGGHGAPCLTSLGVHPVG